SSIPSICPSKISTIGRTIVLMSTQDGIEVSNEAPRV
ncbi:hypothetical protein L195_g032314, partial [Trifolium pratense]